MDAKVKKKSLSPKLQLKKFTINLPVEVAEWIYAKANKEHKSLSYLITEILKEKMEQENKDG